MTLPMHHASVLQNEVLERLEPKEGECVLDVTLGLGGHAKLFAAKIGKSGHIIGLDADSVNLAEATKRLEGTPAHKTFLHVNFGEIGTLDLPPIDVLFADLGLSSPHIDDPERGFTFRADGPLDMRYDRTMGRSARELLAASDPGGLVRIFGLYGELSHTGKIAQLLTAGDIKTSADVKARVEEVYGWRAKQILPQIFQALRIAVNRELESLENLLKIGPRLLAKGGRMGVISYHSLEDRPVKHAFRSLCTPEKDPLTGKVSVPADYELLTPKAIVPTPAEIAENPRARSAKFRIVRRLS